MNTEDLKNTIDNGFEKIGHKVKYHDVKFYTNIEDVLDTEVCFVSVPTHSNEDGSCDTSIVESTLDSLPNGFTAVIKSTVVPGTTQRYHEKYPNLKIAYSPEFLVERRHLEDFGKRPKFLPRVC